MVNPSTTAGYIADQHSMIPHNNRQTSSPILVCFSSRREPSRFPSSSQAPRRWTTCQLFSDTEYHIHSETLSNVPTSLWSPQDLRACKPDVLLRGYISPTLDTQSTSFPSSFVCFALGMRHCRRNKCLIPPPALVCGEFSWCPPSDKQHILPTRVRMSRTYRDGT
ncbi:hypothetical protein BD309DRAFT_949040 [Dichomitus squalens]|nr:hypothetical protein BD309DRAFT_949040 [Dichomitus squalens]